MNVELMDSRRLTGANLYWDLPAAIIDACCDADPAPFIESWSRSARALLAAIGRGHEQLTQRVFDGGFSVVISAPIDVLYSMCELNEAAFESALAATGHGKAADFDESVARLKGLFDAESNPRLLDLRAAAHDHGVPFLWDDDEVSVGYGKNARVWKPDALPVPDEVDWQSVTSIPVALVTGTNGKSTTVRMSAAILAADGLRAGLTSTDWIRIGNTILDTGDYSGTGGARTLMRHPDTEVAVLETARGGMLRRGLGVERVAAALITNVAADHLGEYGINTLPELTEAKFIVRRALGKGAPLILNADDAGIVAFASNLGCNIRWFSLDPENPRIREAARRRGFFAVLRKGWLELGRGGSPQRIIRIDDIPATLNGMARHNVHNALAAIALCGELGASEKAMRQGLSGFRGDEKDNPGRGNWFRKGDIRILVDFAHNVHGMTALADMVGQVPASRRILLMGQAGDRLDKDIAELAEAACRINPDLIMSCELPGYLRGREPGVVPKLIRDAVIAAGVAEDSVRCYETPLEAASTALSEARDGDLMVFLALTQRKEILAQVRRFLES